VQGVVIIEALVDPSGSIANARVLRSIPMLDEAALGAVSRWR
jgi:TonB family protein